MLRSTGTAIMPSGIVTKSLVGCCLLLLGFVAMADYPLTIIDLQHRFAEDLAPVLAPLAGPGGSVSGVNASLLVRASPQGLAEIRQALRRLDLPARNLLVEVRRAGARSASGVDVGVRVDERVGDQGRVRIGESSRGHGASGSDAWALAKSASRAARWYSVCGCWTARRGSSPSAASIRWAIASAMSDPRGW